MFGCSSLAFASLWMSMSTPVICTKPPNAHKPTCPMLLPNYMLEAWRTRVVILPLGQTVRHPDSRAGSEGSEEHVGHEPKKLRIVIRRCEENAHDNTRTMANSGHHLGVLGVLASPGAHFDVHKENEQWAAEQVHDASFPTTGAPRLFNASACNGSEGGTASDAQLPSIKPNPRAVPSLEAATIAAPRQPTYQYFLADQRPGNAMAGANGELMPKARSSPSCHTRIKPEYPQVGEGPDVQPEPMASTASETQRRFFRSSTGNFESTASSLSPAQTLVVERRASLEVLSPRCAAVGVNAWLPSSSSGLETALPEAPGAPSGLSSPTFRMDQCWAGRAFDLITSQK